MKINVLLFTQTMYALLNSSLPLQSALSVCKEILSGKADRKLMTKILKEVNEGKKLADVLSEYNRIFSPLYIALVSIGEESGTLPEVFGYLADYIKDKKNVRQKILQALAYPILVIMTAIVVIFVLMLFVMPRLEGIFMAFTESSEDIGQQMIKMKTYFFIEIFIFLAIILVAFFLAILRKVNDKAAFIVDRVLLLTPLIGKAVMTMQMYDFSFAMKLLVAAHFSLVPSLLQAGNVFSNRYLKKAVESVCKSITGGHGVGDSFEDEGVFPKYLIGWIRIAEYNGNTTEAFGQICDYYSVETENILAGITAFVEPIFILITGIIIIAVIGQFIIPVFNLLGTL